MPTSGERLAGGRRAAETDAVYVDRNGLISSPGTVLVGGYRFPTFGALVDSAFTTGTVHSIGPTGTDFEGLIVERADTLLAVDTVTKAETLILTGPGSTGAMAAFDAAGDLYISQGGDLDRVLHITQSDPTGISDAGATANQRLLHVSPNPAPGSVTVRFARSMSGPLQLDLFDARGRRVLRIHDGFVPVRGGSRDLDVGSLAGGVYFVSARTREGRTTEKVVLLQ